MATLNYQPRPGGPRRRRLLLWAGAGVAAAASAWVGGAWVYARYLAPPADAARAPVVPLCGLSTLPPEILEEPRRHASHITAECFKVVDVVDPFVWWLWLDHIRYRRHVFADLQRRIRQYDAAAATQPLVLIRPPVTE